MKYIVIRHMAAGNIEQELPVIFPSQFAHVEIAEMIIKKCGLQNAKAVSAGDINPMNMECSGRSTTLKLKSRGREDSVLIQMFDYLHGYL